MRYVTLHGTAMRKVIRAIQQPDFLSSSFSDVDIAVHDDLGSFAMSRCSYAGGAHSTPVGANEWGCTHQVDRVVV